LLADGGAKHFALTPNGTQVVLGAHDTGTQADLTLMPVVGGSDTLLVAGAQHGNFDVMGDGTTLLYLDASTSSLKKIQTDGTGGATLVANAVVGIVAMSSQAVVYSTLVDAITGLATLRFVRKTGSSDTALGTLAIDEGFSPDQAYYMFRDQVSGTDGSLEVLTVSSAAKSLLATGVSRSSAADTTRLVYLDNSGLLRQAAFATGTKTTLEDNVTDFRLVPDSFGSANKGRVAFVVAAGKPGVYVASF
jgi:hypothetical protein